MGPYSNLKTSGSLSLYPNANLIMGMHSKFDISVTANVYPGVTISIGHRSVVSFSSNEICNFIADYVVGDFKNVTIDSGTVGVMCVPFG